MSRQSFIFLIVFNLLLCPLQAREDNDPSNAKPVIIGHSTLTTREEESIEIKLKDLEVEEDEADKYPKDYTLQVYTGDNYSVEGSVVTPATNFFGDLSVPVTVNDGELTSDVYNLPITVTAVNDPPVITGQNTLSTLEDVSITITLDDLTVEDPDNVYPADFSLTVLPGDNYQVSGTTVTPSENFFGELVVPVTVNDGENTSAVYNLSVSVTSQNDPPVITGQNTLSTVEDVSITITLDNLIVDDPDNVYPADFSLTVSSGDNYQVSGTTVTPSENFFGELVVPVTVNDGENTSAVYNLSVSVTSQNDPPVITGQNTLEIAEDQSLTIELSHLLVTDVDNEYPTDFTLVVQSGEHYTLSGNTITPESGFNGQLMVPVYVNDGTDNSNTYDLIVSVTATNDAPLITGQNVLQVNEDSPLSIGLSDLTVTDSDNQYPDDFTLQVQSGDNYTVEGTTITPSLNFNGLLSVPVTVNDGENTSNVFMLQVTVVAVNDAPVITGQQSFSSDEDVTFTIPFEALIVQDIDNAYPTGFTMSISSGNNYIVNGDQVTPVENFTGTLSIPITVNDGFANSNTFNFQVQVNGANDPPVILSQTALTSNEDTPFTIALSSLQVQDSDNVYPDDFTINISDGENYSVQGNTITPVTNYSGVLTIPVSVYDGQDNSNIFNFQATITPVNDAPQIVSQVALAYAEDTPFQIQLAYLQVTDPDNLYPQDFTLNIFSGDNYSVSENTITPSTDFTGTLSIAVTVSDGQSNSNTFNLQVSITASNDAPVVVGQSQVTINEDESFTIELSHLQIQDPDNQGGNNFTLTILDGQNYSRQGNTITPSLNYSGVLSVPVIVSDQSSSSNPFQFQITVNPVNDKPIIVGQSPISIYKNKSVVIDLKNLQVTDVDNTYPDDFTLIVNPGENYSVIGNSVTPISNFLGNLTVNVQVSDGGLLSDIFPLVIAVVKPPNVPPVITSQVKLTTYENQSLELKLTDLVVTDPDNIFPDEFSLYVGAGAHYQVNGNTIIPELNYNGQLSVPVQVSDKEAKSNVFNLVIDVLPVSDVPLITSQNFIQISEDDSVTITFAHLIVSDPDSNYPADFTLNVYPGQNYTLNGFQVKPNANFNGYVRVPVTVSDGENTSAIYQLLVSITPVNDAPSIIDEEDGLQYYAVANGPLKIFDTISIEDVDSDSLSFAEITITQGLEDLDSLSWDNQSTIKGVYDSNKGVLLFFGNAPVSIYEQIIKSVSFQHNSEYQEQPKVKGKTLTLVVNDGENDSNLHSENLTFEAPAVSLDIPGGFTPNGDGVNDTWSIKLPDGNAAFNNAVVRVYNQRGVLIFESTGFEKEWDGTVNGNVLPAATYYYTIDLHSRYFRNRYKGIVTILR